MTRTPPTMLAPEALPTLDEVARRIAFWLAITTINAMPSFFVARSDIGPFRPDAMILGILTFGIAAGLASSLPAIRRLSSRPRLRSTVIAVYTIRTVLTLIPMLMMLPDLLAGMVSNIVLAVLLIVGNEMTSLVGLGQPLPSSPSGDLFLLTYILTIIQGIVVNASLWLVILVVALGRTTLAGPEQPSPENGCRRCGYILQGLASGTPCPECGATEGVGRIPSRLYRWSWPRLLLALVLLVGADVAVHVLVAEQFI